MGLELVWGLLQRGFVRRAPPPASQNHFNHWAREGDKTTQAVQLPKLISSVSANCKVCGSKPECR